VVIDHILPVALGGTNKPDNLQVACRSCNQVKRDRHPRDDFHHLIFAAKGDPEYADKPVLRLVKS
jgi:5-methylcytosine-specific restriction endonuclease McrA